MQPKVYSSQDHHIHPKQIDKDALYVMAKLNQVGHLAYLVGGSVRDLLMGKTPKDVDIATSAKPEEIKKLFSHCFLIGRRFRLAHVRFGKKVIEVSTFRSGDINESELILRDNIFGTPEEDVLRRDFTINGLFYDPKEHQIIDFVGGREDLAKHLLRAIGPPIARFKQDPVRMVRLLKFRARFGFHVEQETQEALLTCKDEITKSSPARLLEEFLRMLESTASAPFIRLLCEHGFLELLLPGLQKYLRDHPSIYGYLDACDELVRINKRSSPDRSVLLCSLLFPALEQTLKKLPSSSFQTVLQTTDELMNQMTLSSFFPFPRRLRTLSHFILNTQFRLTPLGQRRSTRLRISRHPDFPYALQFLHLRTLVEPNLKEIYDFWKSRIE